MKVYQLLQKGKEFAQDFEAIITMGVCNRVSCKHLIAMLKMTY